MKIYKGMFDKYNDIYKNDNLWQINESYKYPLDVKDVVDNYSPEELIEAIGLDKVEMILRKKKLEKLKTKIK